MILGIIPARRGSKRIPGKNTKFLGQKRLIEWALDSAVQSKLLDQIVVSSDDPEVLEAASLRKQCLPLKRPEHLATDTSLAIEFVRHALHYFAVEQKRKFTAVAILQPTSPFTLPEDIDRGIQLFKSTGAESVVSVMTVPHAFHPLKAKRMEKDRLVPFVAEEDGKMAQHELPEVFVRNCALYITQTSVIEKGRILGQDCRGFLMPVERSLDINDPIDWAFAEFLIEQKGRP